MKPLELEAALRGYSMVLALQFSSERETGGCTLILRLARDVAKGSPALEAEFSDVARLTLSNFGGGIPQLVFLRVHDVSADQHDRLNIHVEEVEHEAFSFYCRAARILGHFALT